MLLLQDSTLEIDPKALQVSYLIVYMYTVLHRAGQYLLRLSIIVRCTVDIDHFVAEKFSVFMCESCVN